LNDAGILQARELLRYFENITVDSVYTSPKRRAVDTSRIVFGKSRPIIKEESLREIDFGLWEGLTHAEALKRYPKEYSAWAKDPLNAMVERGESFKRLKKRVVVFFDALLKNDKGKTLAIVSHSGPIRVILCHALKLSQSDFWNLKVEPASVNYLEYKDGIIKSNIKKQISK